jgi:hypothetical protein
VSLRTRLEKLEGTAGSFRNISRDALKALSDEELEALEDMLEAGAGEDLYAAATERGRRALDAYTYALEAVRRSEAHTAMDAMLEERRGA